MYSGGFYNYQSIEENWAFWSRMVFVNRYTDVDNGTYKRLFEIVKDKDYFVLTTNVDHQFQKTGFDKMRLFYTQGDYGLFQCSEPCHNMTYDNELLITQMIDEQKDMKIPTELVPKCPECGKPMTMNLRCDDKFVQDEGWYRASRRYSEFLRSHNDGHILFLELGVGFNTPIIIKYPFWKMTAENPNAVYACVNYGEAVCPDEIADRAICIDGDIGAVLERC
jgi:NAD-dependent SIR2 family protein deacetylase